MKSVEFIGLYQKIFLIENSKLHWYIGTAQAFILTEIFIRIVVYCRKKF